MKKIAKIKRDKAILNALLSSEGQLDDKEIDYPFFASLVNTLCGSLIKLNTIQQDR